MSKATDPGSTESELIRRIREGQTDVFEALIHPHLGKIYALALRMTGNTADAEDALQEACLLAFSRLGTFRGEAAFGTWFYRIALNSIYMGFRRRPGGVVEDIDAYLPRFDANGTILDGARPIALDPEDETIRAEVGAILEAAVRRLPPDFRAVLVARDVDGLSTDETAEALGLTRAAVKSRLHRARLSVRKQLERRFDPAGAIESWLGTLSGLVRTSGRRLTKRSPDG